MNSLEQLWRVIRQQDLVDRLKLELEGYKGRVRRLENDKETVFDSLNATKQKLHEKIDQLTVTLQIANTELTALRLKLVEANVIVPKYAEAIINKYPKRTLIMGNRFDLKGNRINVDVRTFLSTYYDAQFPQITTPDNKSDSKALKCLKYVVRNIAYKSDQVTQGVNEFWQLACETHNNRTGDCVSVEEEIYIEGNTLKKVGGLVVGDRVLSYDFGIGGGYCYKPITKIWEKGKLSLKRIHLRNGQHIDITADHPLWVRNNQKGKSEYEKKQLSEIDLTRWWKRKLPIAKHIPRELIKDDPFLDKDFCFILGHFVAEGYTDKCKVGTCGYDVIEHIIPLLEKKGIPFSEGKNGNGVPTINFLKSKYKEYLKPIVKNSFEIKLPETLFNLPKTHLESFLDGYYLGDGHDGHCVYKSGCTSNKHDCYSTSCEQLATDIQRIGLILGESFHIWKQEKHGGVGTKPIYRITQNTNSYFLRDYGYEGISEVSISFIEDLPAVEMRDFEVADTHTFIFKNGLISHQCEDGAIYLGNLLLKAGIPWWRVRPALGDVKDPNTGGSIGHAYVTYCRETDDKFVTLDTSYYTDTKTKIADRILHNQQEDYYSTFASFDLKNVYAQHDYATSVAAKKYPFKIKLK